MTLLRNWQLLESLIVPTLVMMRPVERLVVWNLDHVDNALAIVLAYLHCSRGATATDIVVFHTGRPPGPKPIEWTVADIRGVPREPWLDAMPGARNRWTPRPEVMQRVVLGPPPGTVDVVIGGRSPLGPDGDLGLELARLRHGGLAVWPETAGAGPAVRPAGFEACGEDGRVIRKLGACSRRKVPGSAVAEATRPGSYLTSPSGPVATPEGGITLAEVQDQARLVESHANLARSLARRFANRGERVEDLEQVACLALIKAASRYRPEKERPFSVFATACVLGELKRHFRDKLWMVRVPRSVQEMHLAIRAAREELTALHGASPTIAQIAGYVGATEEAVLSAMEAVTNSWPTSLDLPDVDGEGPGSDVPVNEAGFDRSLDRRVLKESISQLSPTERLILKRVFFDGCTQRQVAEEIGVSQMQISRLMNRTLGRLRQSFQVA